MISQFLGSLAIGPISRSAHAAAIHRRVRDGHANVEEFENAIKLDQEKILEVQKRFVFSSAGQSDWLDLLRPIACKWDGFSSKNSKPEDVGPVTRWFRTNTFYRKPTVNGKIKTEGFELKDSLPKLNENGIVFLLGPYSFSNLVENTYYSDLTKLACDYVNAVAKNSLSLVKEGYSAILFLEPYIGYSLSRQETIDLNQLQEPLKKMDFKKLKVGIHFPKTNISQLASSVEETEIDFIGIDTLYVQPPEVSTSKDVLFGIVDGSRAAIEDKERVKKQLNLFLKNAHFSGRYYIGPNDRLWDVPFDIALEKLKQLDAVGSELNE